MNYEKDLHIDETALDIEWLDQPMIFMRYARYAAEMKKDSDEAKQNIDIVKSEVDKDVRENPDKYGLEKITDKAVEAIVLSSEELKEAQQNYLRIKFESDMAYNAVQAFNMRKEALENLVKLNGQQYFAGPSIPRDLHEQRQARQKDMNIRIGEKMRRNK